MAKSSIPAGNIRCNSCRHYDFSLSDFDDIARCKRYPPTYTPGIIRGELDRKPGDTAPHYLNVTGAGEWPYVHGAYWCGEYEPRP